MNARNVFRNKPDFNELAKEYPSFAVFVKLKKNGKATIDFKNADALRALTTILLKKYFDISVLIPQNRLIPAVPQRLNYVLWIEDLLIESDVHTKSINAIDIGTGSCCIFPLLAVRNNKNWNFVATESDPLSLQYAIDNVLANDLQHRIKGIKSSAIVFVNCFLSVVPAAQETLIVQIVQDQVDFVMCNPPFFESKFDIEMIESSQNRDGYRSPSSSNTACECESVTDGGEISFVTKLIEESLVLRNKVKLYTVMLGKKKSLTHLKAELQKHSPEIVTSFASTEFYQGKTVRWGLAWTFNSNFRLKTVNFPKKKKHKVLSFELRNAKIVKYEFRSVYEQIRSLLVEELNIHDFDVIRDETSIIELWVKSKINTWSHQRRKRRMQTRAESMQICEIESFESVETTDDKSIEIGKRKLDTSEELSFSELEENEPKRMKNINSTVVSKDEELCVLHCSVRLRKVNKSILVEFKTMEKSSSTESTYQFFQYFKNKLI